MKRLVERIHRRFARLSSKIRILIAMWQMLTQLSTVFDITFPSLFASLLRWMRLVNLDLVQLSAFECTSFVYNFYASLVAVSVLPLVAVAILLVGQRAFKAAGKEEAGSRCVVVACHCFL